MVTVFCDTREKKNSHVLAYFDRHNIQYELKKLDIGDYQTNIRPGRSIDRKRNLEELARNLCTKDRTRFWNEVRLAHKSGIKLIVLVEQNIDGIEGVKSWNSKYSKITGKYLANEIYKCHIAYGTEFLFCSRRSTGKKIIQLLMG